VHGGTHKAVYCYQRQHYDYWRAELPGTDLPFGMFGENLTIDGPGEDDIHLGDAFTVGSAAVVVTQPRLPCYKLGLKFQSDDMVKRFLASRRTGFYLAVTREGDVGAGDDLVEIARDPNAVPVSDVTRLYVTKRYNADDTASMQRILQVSAVPDSWKEWFRGRLADV
jgi:MOSC domain-containing protein YiiM